MTLFRFVEFTLDELPAVWSGRRAVAENDLPPTPEELMKVIAMEHSIYPGSYEHRPSPKVLVERLELVLINDEARADWIELIEAATGVKEGLAWTDASRHVTAVLQNGLRALATPDLCRFGLDRLTIRRWSALILDTLPDAWWQKLLVQGRMANGERD